MQFTTILPFCSCYKLIQLTFIVSSDFVFEINLALINAPSKILNAILEICETVRWIIEISFVEIYENQASRNELIEFMKPYSFEEKDKCNISKIENKLFQEDVFVLKDKSFFWVYCTCHVLVPPQTINTVNN